LGIIAILSSPSSFAGSDEMNKIRAVISRGSGIFHYEVEKHNDIAEALTRFRQAGVEAIAILGDRALTSATFDYIIEKDILAGTSIPLAILPVGDNNIVAENLGATRSEPHLALETLLRHHQSGDISDRVTEYPVIKLEGVRGVGCLYGLFFCAGAILKQKNLFGGKIAQKGLFAPVRRGLNIFTLIKNGYRGTLGKNRLENAIRINRNQRGAIVGHFFMVVITTLDRIFHGVAIGQQKHYDKAHFISVENTPRAIIETGKLMLRGNYDGIDHAGNIIAEIRHARLILQTPFILDGSFYETEGSGEIFITLTERLKFIRL